jgi:hypothetical protein
MSDEQIAASSAADSDFTPTTAADRAVVSGDIASYRSARLAERAGKPLDPAAVSDSASDEPAEQAASTDATSKPASEPGKPSGHQGNAETRKKELDAEIQSLLKQRADLRREVEGARLKPQAPDAKPAVSSPAPAKMETDPEPKLEDFTADAEKYPDPYLSLARASARWEARQELRSARAADERRAASEKHAESLRVRAETFRDTLAKATEADPGFMDSISDDVKALRPFDALAPGETPTGYNAIAEEVLSSANAPALMKHFSAHPEDLHRIAGLQPRELLRELGRLDARLDGGVTPAPKPAGKTVSGAPAPPTTLGSRGADPTSDADAAVRNDDVAAYRAARLRERIAAMRG